MDELLICQSDLRKEAWLLRRRCLILLVLEEDDILLLVGGVIGQEARGPERGRRTEGWLILVF